MTSEDIEVISNIEAKVTDVEVTAEMWESATEFWGVLTPRTVMDRTTVEASMTLDHSSLDDPAARLSAVLSSLIDDLDDTTTGLGRLVACPTPAADDNALCTFLAVAAQVRNLSDTLLTLTGAALDRAGVAARRRESVATMMRAVGVPPIVASRSVTVGAALRSLPTVAAVLGDARLSGEHAAAIVGGLHHITRRVGAMDAEQRDKLVSNLLAQALSGTPNDVTTWARATAIAMAPEDADLPVADNRELNETTLSTSPDGRTRIDADIDCLFGEKLQTALDALMTPVPLPDGNRDPRSAAQRRADGLEHIVDSYLRSRHQPKVGGELPHVTVTIPHTHCRCSHQPTDTSTAGDRDLFSTPTPPARLGFGGPVTAATAQMIACDCALSLMTINSNNVPLDVKQRDRLFPPELRRALVVRDHGCSFPGCGRPPGWCQAHHLTPWSQGGVTVLENGALLCQMHHTKIHHTGWEMRMGDDRHPWFSAPPDRLDGPRRWIRSHARRTMTSAADAAA